MLKELKELFTTKKGILILLTIGTCLITAYLNIITIKSLVIEGWNNFEVSYGTLLISFIPMLIGDLLAEVYGWKKSFIISSVSYAVCFLFVLILWGTTKLPGIVFGGSATDAYNMLFSQQPSILIGSAVAYYAGIFFNSYIMGMMQKRAIAQGKNNSASLFFRCILSTIVGQLLDNGLFFLIAYAPGLVDPVNNYFYGNWTGTVESARYVVWTYIWQQIVAAFVIEVVYEIILFPVTKVLTKKVSNLPERLKEDM